MLLGPAPNPGDQEDYTMADFIPRAAIGIDHPPCHPKRRKKKKKGSKKNKPAVAR